MLRVVARLDVKGQNLIKGVQFEGLRVLGQPNDFAKKYYEQGVDEIIFNDCVASLYGRNNLLDTVKNVASNVFVPLTVCGGIRSADDVTMTLRCGADKVAINTAAINNPGLITQLTEVFGNQCVVLSVEAKKTKTGWECYTDNGRERTGKDVISWCEQAASIGVGEILLTSIDNEGTRRGLDVELVHEVSKVVKIPIIASGGVSDPSDVVHGFKSGAQAVAVADGFHYQRFDVSDVKTIIKEAEIPVRLDG
jgi:cyclase